MSEMCGARGVGLIMLPMPASVLFLLDSAFFLLGQRIVETENGRKVEDGYWVEGGRGMEGRRTEENSSFIACLNEPISPAASPLQCCNEKSPIPAVCRPWPMRQRGRREGTLIGEAESERASERRER